MTKINPTGSALVYSTYLDGSSYDHGNGIAADNSGDAYITGDTTSTNFPTMNPLQPANGGGIDAFVSKLNPSGSALVYSTYLGGSGTDYGQGIAVDTSGSAYVSGSTGSTNFPITPGAFQTIYGGDQDAFVAKIAPQVAFASLINLVKQFETKRVVAAIMVDTLKWAQVAEREHDVKLADAILDVFIDEVSEQSGKSLTAAHAATLIHDAKALMV